MQFLLSPYNSFDNRRRAVSPGPESKYLSSGNLAEQPIEEKQSCEGEFHGKKFKRWNSQDSGLYEGTLKPVSDRRHPDMFTPSWRKTPEPDNLRPTSPHWQSFSEAAFGGSVQGNYTDHYVPPCVRSPSRSRTLSCESGGARESKLAAHTMASQTNTHVDRLARSGSAASLAVVMASTYPNGGDANFDLEGTAARISEVCKSLGGSENNLSAPTVKVTRSRSINSALNVIHSPDAKNSPRPFFMGQEATPLKIRVTPEKRMGEPLKAKPSQLSYKELKELQEKLRKAEHGSAISYRDLITCPRNRLPSYVDKQQLEDYLSDSEFVDVFQMNRSDFDSLAKWKRIQMKKDVLLF